MLRILIAHNFYQQAGGEDVVFENEERLLASKGHSVFRYTLDNHSIPGLSLPGLLGRTFWNQNTWTQVRSIIRTERIDLVHCHNTFPLISAAIYSAADRERTPVVQTLHNYRLICAAGTMVRNGAQCEECPNAQSMIPGIFHRCYRGSAAATVALIGSAKVHRALGNWAGKVQQYIALSQFMKSKLVSTGLPAERITVKPNFPAIDLTVGAADGNYALFVGRLSPEKGLGVLLDAWSRLSELPLRIAGSGPEQESLADRARAMPNVTLLGWQSPEQVRELMRGAYCLVVPSLAYEGFPLTIAEAYSAGLPVIASGHGSLAELVRDGMTGLHFRAGDASDLVSKAMWLFSNPGERLRMGTAARSEYLSRFTPEASYQVLIKIYTEAIRLCASGA